jgi:ppGpp synthetase/RelA/SpoT-type nucleotidyltranferase
MDHQLTRIAEDCDVALAFPVQSRVKEWSSISEKLQRKSLRLRTING